MVMTTDDLTAALNPPQHSSLGNEPVTPVHLLLFSLSTQELKRRLLGHVPGVAKKKKNRPGKKYRQVIKALIDQKKTAEGSDGVPTHNPNTADMTDFGDAGARMLSTEAASSVRHWSQTAQSTAGLHILKISARRTTQPP